MVQARPVETAFGLWRWANRTSVVGTSSALIGSQLIMALAGVVSSRALGPDGKGVTTAVLTWPLTLSWLALLGLNTASSVRVAAHPGSDLRDALGNALLHSLVAGVFVAVCAALVLPAVIADLGSDAESLIQWAVFAIPLFMVADMLMSLNFALGRLRHANLSRLAGPILMLGLIAGLALAGDLTPTNVVVVTIVGAAVGLLVAAFGLPWRRIAVDLRKLVGDLQFGLKTHLTSLLGLTTLRLDLLLMSALVAAAEVGYYGVANNVMLPIGSVAAAAAALLTPAVARAAPGGLTGRAASGHIAHIRRQGRIYLAVALAGGVLVGVAAPFLVPALFGSAFQPAVVLIWILIPGYVGRAYATVLTAGAVGARRTWVGNVTEGVGLVVTLALLPFLLPRYGAVGAAVTSTIAYTSCALTARLALRRLARTAAESSVVPGKPEPLPVAEVAPRPR